MGGGDEAENLVHLTIEEHAEAHRLLWLEHGKQADFMAWQMLSGKTDASEEMRIAVAVEAFREMLADPERKASWVKKISESLRGQIQSPETREKRRQTHIGLHRDPDFRRRFLEVVARTNHWSPTPEHHEKMARGRKASRKWKDSVTSDEYRRKKVIADPRSLSVIISGVRYHSLRQAARESGIPACHIDAVRKGLKTDDRISFPQLSDGLPDQVLGQETMTSRDSND